MKLILGLRYCRDPTSASERYDSHKHFSTKTAKTNEIFSEKQIFVETNSSKLNALQVSLSH